MSSAPSVRSSAIRSLSRFASSYASFATARRFACSSSASIATHAPSSSSSRGVDDGPRPPPPPPPPSTPSVADDLGAAVGGAEASSFRAGDAMPAMAPGPLPTARTANTPTWLYRLCSFTWHLWRTSRRCVPCVPCGTYTVLSSRAWKFDRSLMSSEKWPSREKWTPS